MGLTREADSAPRSSCILHRRCFVNALAMKTHRFTSGSRLDLHNRLWVWVLIHGSCALRALPTTGNATWSRRPRFGTVPAPPNRPRTWLQSKFAFVIVPPPIFVDISVFIFRLASVSIRAGRTSCFSPKSGFRSYPFVAPSRTFVRRTGPHVSDTRLTIA